jgi:hypothetical protein
MLMPFFETNNTPEEKIDYSKCQPVSVIAMFNIEGKIRPVYFGLMDLYGNVCKVRIDFVSSTKTGNGCMTYCCLYNSEIIQRRINLTYYISQHLWVLENQ